MLVIGNKTLSFCNSSISLDAYLIESTFSWAISNCLFPCGSTKVCMHDLKQPSIHIIGGSSLLYFCPAVIKCILVHLLSYILLILIMVYYSLISFTCTEEVVG
jgi:hypothetical protein